MKNSHFLFIFFCDFTFFTSFFLFFRGGQARQGHILKYVHVWNFPEEDEKRGSVLPFFLPHSFFEGGVGGEGRDTLSSTCMCRTSPKKSGMGTLKKVVIFFLSLFSALFLMFFSSSFFEGGGGAGAHCKVRACVELP